MSLSTEIRATDRIAFVGQVLDEVSLRGREPGPSDRHVVYPYALYVRIRPAVDRPFTNPGRPHRPGLRRVRPPRLRRGELAHRPALAYGYPTTMRPEPPPSRRELLLNRGGGWAVRYPRATATVGPQGLPLVSARRWDTGVSAQWDGEQGGRRRRRHGRYAVVAAVRRRQRRQADLRPGRVHAHGQLQRRRVGRRRRVSVRSRRAHRLRRRRRAAAAGALETHRQQALGLDAEYLARPRRRARRGGGEPVGRAVPERRPDAAARRPRDLPRNADRAHPALVDGGARRSARLLARGGANGVVRTWDANVLRVEGAVGYLVRRNVRLKAGYQYNWRDGGRIRTIGLAGAQLLYWF